ncbi:hypothetical protein FACS1894130_05340 [Spirochaetia bacterium]|nr:hypothetical protein FACS1894130_05340 [Spirochaetia bacterium]
MIHPGAIHTELEADKAEVIALLLRMTEKNGHTIALVFPDESADFIRGYTAGQIDAFRLALEHVRDGE